MKNPRILALQAKLITLGVTISNEDAVDLINHVLYLPETLLEVGDFVERYGGMGNVHFSRIEEINGDTVEIRNYDLKERTFTEYLLDYSLLQASNWHISSQEEADAYYKAMMNYDKPKA